MALLSLIKKISNHSFVAPFYHTVSDMPLPHLKYLYPIKSIKQFKNDLDYLLKYFDPIGLVGLQEYLIQHRRLPENKFFLSFDDGFAECATIIAPILKAKGIPATFFINTAFVDNKDLMYRCKASLVFHQYKKKHNNLTRRKAKTLYKTLMKKTYAAQNEFGVYFDLYNIDIEAYLKKRNPYLSVEQIAALEADGFTIGAHSVDHPWFRDISYELQQWQVRKSIEDLKKIAPTLNSFSFPFSDEGITSNLLKFIYTQNITLTFACAGIKCDMEWRHIQRLAMEQGFNANYATPAKRRIPFNFSAFLLKKLLHKHKVNRPSLS